jgi:hypothetical protein
MKCVAVIDTPQGARRCKRITLYSRTCWQHTQPKAPAIDTRTLQDMGECNLCCFWLDRNGKAYHLNDDWAGYGSHGGVAREALNDDTGGRRLDDEGYVHVSYADAYMGDARQEATQAQLDYLFDVQQEFIRRDRTDKAGWIGKFIDRQLEQKDKVTA